MVGCACSVYDTANVRQTHTYAEPYLTIFAFGSDHFRSTSGAFGHVQEIRRLGGTRFWRVWRLERVISSVWARPGDSQVRRHAVLAGLAVGARVFISLGKSGRFVG